MSVTYKFLSLVEGIANSLIFIDKSIDFFWSLTKFMLKLLNWIIQYSNL